MAKLVQGDDIQKDVEALGVLWIRIHKAVGLSKQERRGKDSGGSDLYIVSRNRKSPCTALEILKMT